MAWDGPALFCEVFKNKQSGVKVFIPRRFHRNVGSEGAKSIVDFL
jgi:hypothetical protein